MDLNSLFRGALPTFVANMTAPGNNATGKHVLESLAPLLGGQFNPLLRSFILIYQMVGTHLGFDPTVVLTLFGFIWAVNKVVRQLYMTLYSLCQEHLMANVHINSGDEMYLHMMKWLAGQPAMFNSRSVTAETTSKTAWEDEDESDVSAMRIFADGAGVYLNFSSQEAKAPPRFVPALGTHGFWHNGRYFRLHRKQESFLDDGAAIGGFQTFKDKEKLIISCFGRSPDPVKKLLQHAKEEYYETHNARTTIKRPSAQHLRRYGGRHSWQVVANRPVRPMKTVVLDSKQKLQVLADINEYLHPRTPVWYANRGIPLRRGYLFHGPPGTGKTSLSFALAGVFGLDIYVISLLEPSLTEEDLSALFNSLPRRCVVLLEDIDTAGLSRPQEEGADKTDGKNDGSAPKDWKVSDLARALKEKGNDPNDKKGISLSGLLNAIDGVASHEGRVLIMTTNRPEALDEALIRPGRVDLQVSFGNATREQAQELFERMYEADHSHAARMKQAALRDATSRKTAAANGSAHSGTADGSAAEPEPLEHTNGHAQNSGEKMNGFAHADGQAAATTAEIQHDERLDITEEELSKIAAEFADKIPERQFSPAEIQGFLLKRKKNPRKAVLEVERWVEAMVELKASKTKVMQVQ